MFYRLMIGNKDYANQWGLAFFASAHNSKLR
jgi:hypothetical protein